MHKRWLLERMAVEVWSVYEWIFSLFPGTVGMLIRKIMIAPFFSYSGSRLKSMWSIRISELAHFWKPWNVIITGSDVRFGRCAQINAEGKILLGSHVMMGPFVMITTVTHGYKQTDIPMRSQKGKTEDVIIEDDVWIGGHVSVLPGVTLRRGSVIGAGAVVTKSTHEPYAVYAGVPAVMKMMRRDAS